MSSCKVLLNLYRQQFIIINESTCVCFDAEPEFGMGLLDASEVLANLHAGGDQCPPSLATLFLIPGLLE